MSRLRLLAAALLPFAACTSPQVELTTRVYPTDAVTVHGDEVWRAYRVIDGLSGAPIAGAELLEVEERKAPIRGEMWYRHRAVADTDGFVRIRVDESDKQCWLVLRAPGYAPAMENHAFDNPVVPLAPALDVPVLVLDEEDRPVVGALVGFCGGCGHTPDLVDATTDAQGIAVLRGVDLYNGIADLYLEHPDCDLGYDSVRWYPGDPPARLLPGPGEPIEGVVVDTNGAPVAGVPVGVHLVHRGPWTRTAADGSFRLCGVCAGNDVLFVQLEGREVVFEAPPSMPNRLQLPPPNGEASQVVDLPRSVAALAEDQYVQVELRTEEADGEATLTGPGPSEEVTRCRVTSRGVQLSLIPGEYELRFVGAGYRELVQRVVIDDEHDEVLLAPEPLPQVLVRVENADWDPHVSMTSGGVSWSIDEEVREGRPIGIDDRGPVTFEIHGPHGSRRLVRFAPGEAVKDPELLLRWYEPTRLLGRLVDSSGELVPARVAVVHVDWYVEGLDLRELDSLVPSDGLLDLAAGEVGLALLAVVPDDSALVPRLIPVSFPDRGDDQSLELGDIVLSPTARVTVAGEESATLLRRGWPLRRHPPSFPVDERGRWLGPDPHAGDAILLPGAEEGDLVDLPYRTLLAGDGPWTLRPPAGTLQIDVRDDEGEPLDALVFVADQVVEVYAPTTLRRVPTGSQRLFVATEDHLSAVVALDVRESGTAPLAITLPRR